MPKTVIRGARYLLGAIVLVGCLALLIFIGSPSPDLGKEVLDPAEIRSCEPPNDTALQLEITQLARQGLWLDQVILSGSRDKTSPEGFLCPEGIRVECANPPPYFPSYQPDICLITFSTVFGCPRQLPGGPLPPAELFDFFENVVENSQTPNDCFLGCIGLHETVHADDWQRNPSIRMCLSELHAFRRSIECLKKCDWKHCPFQLPGVFTAEEDPCEGLAKNIRIQEAAYQVNMCICNRPTEPIGREDPICESCLKSCRAAGHIPQFCEMAVNTYCRPFRSDCSEPMGPPAPTDLP